MTGKLITFEGNECSGKGTQIKLLEEYLLSKGHKVRSVREPGGTEISEEIRVIAKKRDSFKETFHPETQLCLFQAARCQLTKEIIKPALHNGEIVLCDRFYDSTWVYQGWVGGINTLIIEFCNKLAVGALTIDKTFLLDVSIENINERLKSRNITSDYFDNQGVDFFRKVNEGYCELYNVYKNRIDKIDSNRSIEEVHQEIVDKIQTLIN